MKTLTLLALAIALTGCQTPGPSRDMVFCGRLFPTGSVEYGRCVMHRDQQSQQMGLVGAQMLYGLGAGLSRPYPSYRY